MLEGEAALKQTLRTYCRMVLGEDLYDIRNGVDYFGTVFSPQPNLDAARASLTGQLMKHKDVLSVDSLTMAIMDSKLVYVATVATIYGSLEISN